MHGTAHVAKEHLEVDIVRVILTRSWVSRTGSFGLLRSRHLPTWMKIQHDERGSHGLVDGSVSDFDTMAAEVGDTEDTRKEGV